MPDKEQLERELRRSVFYLPADKRGLFKRGRFSYAAKRITSECGKFAIVWAPNGTKRGDVKLVTI